MKYLVLVRYVEDGELHEITECFSNYDAAFNYAQHEYYETRAEEVSCDLYELKDFWT